MRSAATLTVAYVLLILQSTVLELAPVHMAAPSFGLLIVLHLGLSPKWTISSAAVVAFVHRVPVRPGVGRARRACTRSSTC